MTPAEILNAIETNVRERLAEGDGVWITCTGCHESEDGHDVGYYPHSEVFGCKLGGGCGECGGIGAIWDTTDYGAMADDMIKADDELQRKPRRRIVFIAKIEADDWPSLQAQLRDLATHIAMHDRLSPWSISGGYSAGNIYVTSEDGSIDHDAWALQLNAYIESLPKVPA